MRAQQQQQHIACKRRNWIRKG